MKAEVLPGWSQSWDSTKLFQLPFSKMLQIGNVCVHAVPWIKVGMRSAPEGSEVICPSGPISCSVFGGTGKRAQRRKPLTGVLYPMLLPGPSFCLPGHTLPCILCVWTHRWHGPHILGQRAGCPFIPQYSFCSTAVCAANTQ